MGHFSENGLHCELMREDKITLIQFPVKVLLMGLGEDINREGIIKTPLRVAKALCEGTNGDYLFLHKSHGPNYYYWQSTKQIVEGALFLEEGIENRKIGDAGGVGGLVIVRNLDFYSYCESCMLPFYFKCHVGYVPSGQRVLGLSKLSRVTNVFAKRLQELQHLANAVCSALHQGINLEGSGVFEDKDANIWSEFFGLLKFRGINKDKIHVKGSLDQCWCPSLCSKDSSKIGEINPIMVSAVSSILKSLGEDPTRKELVGTPGTYVKWLMNFQCGEIGDIILNGSLGNGISDSLNTNKEVQERLTKQIAETISPLIGGNVIVVVEASHTCIMSRGIEKFRSSTTTIAVLGHFSTNLAAKDAFLKSIPYATSLEKH
ncbi:hypothetical protein VNO78_24290 [Psophocarpus tetragonolobus]|uniref:GTP cyclohydrolase 1 n=1 Tax=Psophocarpus tetragonolobus TaxID=3891 RepID=A0AAN9S4H3_PSOTE